MGFSQLLQYVQLSSACLSILACIFIIASFLIFPNLRSFLYKLIAYMCVADLLGSVCYILAMIPSACFIQALLTYFFSIAALIWTTCIGIHLFQVLVQHSRQAEAAEPYFHLLAWGVAGILTAVAGAWDIFGNQQPEPGCGVVSSVWWWPLLWWYVPVLLALVVNTTLYLFLLATLRQNQDPCLPSVRARLIQYWLCLVVLRLANVLHLLHPSSTTQILHVAISPLQGFVDAMVYGLNLQVRNHYKLLMFPRMHEPLAMTEIT
eukprot:TRINITY_DN17605_c0_g3_i3.p1 TRINITY_DN17605_c0_g3~~TRINITY_DN17605_c0_g3_i3.p1  ORF type:complete len:263 (+),score=27.09 TRINITY_DN17605_c0_g3_i3:136-924(+)